MQASMKDIAQTFSRSESLPLLLSIYTKKLPSVFFALFARSIIHIAKVIKHYDSMKIFIDDLLNDQPEKFKRDSWDTENFVSVYEHYMQKHDHKKYRIIRKLVSILLTMQPANAEIERCVFKVLPLSMFSTHLILICLQLQAKVISLSLSLQL